MTTKRFLAGMLYLPLLGLCLTASVPGQTPQLDGKWVDGPSPKVVRALLEDELAYLGVQDKVSAADLDALTRLKVKADTITATSEERKNAYQELLTKMAQLTGAPPGFESRMARTAQAALGLSQGSVILPGEFAQVEKRGTGPVPMILIPDFGLDWSVYDAFMERNAKAFTMYAVTLPGAAGTSPYPRPKIRDYARTDWLNAAEQALVNLIQKEKLSGVVLVGQQAGSYLCMKTALNHPELVKAAVSLNGLLAAPLNAAAAPAKPVTVEDRARMMSSAVSMTMWPSISFAQSFQFLSGFTEGYCRNEARRKILTEMNARTRLDIAYRYLYELMTTDLSEAAKKLTVPWLVITSVPDEKAPSAANAKVNLTQWETFKTENPKIPLTLVTFEDTRAYATEDSPSDLDRALTEFLSGKPVAGKKQASK